MFLLDIRHLKRLIADHMHAAWKHRLDAIEAADVVAAKFDHIAQVEHYAELLINLLHRRKHTIPLIHATAPCILWVDARDQLAAERDISDWPKQM